jgi:hypothetical protein
MKSRKHVRETVPPQRQGLRTYTEYAVNLPTVEEALRRFDRARERLLEVNNWKRMCGALSASFTLTDETGNEVRHKAEEGDHIRINLPGPGSQTGDGFDWVEIEKIEDKASPSGRIAYVAMRVRPSENPQKVPGKVAHFFQEDATSSFVVERTGSILRARVYGRNEQPNTAPPGLWDKIRNFLVAVSASLGLAKPQWKSLAKALLR